MKVMIVISSLSGGGAERVASSLSQMFVEQHELVRIITFDPGVNDFYELDPRVSRGRLLSSSAKSPLAPLRNIHRVLSLRKEIVRFDPDVVLGFMTTANVLVALASLGLRCATLGSERTFPPAVPLGFLREVVRRWTYRILDGVVALTSESARWLSANTLARSVAIIPNAVTWPIPRHHPIVPTEIACHPGRKILLSVGRLDSGKRFDELIAHFAAIRSEHHLWDLVIVGEGPERARLQKLIVELEGSQRIFLPGSVGNIGDWYACGNLYVSTSSFEGFPNSLLEAMSYGLACIAYDVNTGPRDIITHAVDGLLIPEHDTTSMRRAIADLMSSDDRRGRLGNQAVAVRDRFSRERILAMWQGLLSAIICH